ncbi:hypothetical protein Tdes44962_MAKER08609 [Teratosphaeria destructans]|uniref:Uncharacterized protein n=1 Tax=Teratosphaeria destructans TaxID=418781 RepID=A0A9W7W489_9PEZI|nr:hypothetical protein Tdes44962_MAKER08609 [Teratosphaeria destructans]
MHEHAAAGLEGVLDEAIAGGEMLEEILVVDIVDLDQLVLEAVEERGIQRRPQDGQHMRDAGRPQRFSAAEREEAKARRGRR